MSSSELLTVVMVHKVKEKSYEEWKEEDREWVRQKEEVLQKARNNEE